MKNKSCRNIFACLGPGVISGAAGDDPSGIVTYSNAGAQQGTSMLWTALLTWPLMGCVQMMCARVGMVTGVGMASALAKKFPRNLVLVVCLCLLTANVINIGADLAGMGDAIEVLVGLPAKISVVALAILITVATITFSYQKISSVLKWLTATLFLYVITGFIVKPDWLAVARDTFIPSLPHGKDGWQTLTAILGTTISPYLFFWQAASEVEEEKKKGRATIVERQGASDDEISDRRMDVGIGTFFSNLVMFFIMLTTAVTLNKHGVHEIQSAKDAAEALKPVAGSLATTFYTLGVLSTGLLAIPTLAGSAGFAISETLHLSHGLDKKPRQAKTFYAIIVLSAFLGVAMNYLGINPIKALVWSAVVNGVLAPFLLAGIIYVATDNKLMLNQSSPKALTFVVAATSVAMFLVAIAMFIY